MQVKEEEWSHTEFEEQIYYFGFGFFPLRVVEGGVEGYSETMTDVIEY